MKIKTLIRGRGLWLMLAASLAVFLPAAKLSAQGFPSSVPAAVSSNRFLFVVETSAAMRLRSPAAVKAVGDLIASGANAQMRAGDTIGLWTFNQQVYSELPVQTWTPGDRNKIALRTATFLRQQRYENAGQLDKVFPNLFELVNASDFITVIVLSATDGKMKGTPFDAEINALYEQTIKDMKGQRMPLVTVLQARGGKFLKYTVNALPWPVVIPEIPVQINPPAAATPQPAHPETPPVVPRPASQPPAVLKINETLPQPVTSAPVVASTPMAPPAVKPASAPPVPAPTPAVTPATVAPAPITATPPPVEIARMETPAAPPLQAPPPAVIPKPAAPNPTLAATPIATQPERPIVPAPTLAVSPVQMPARNTAVSPPAAPPEKAPAPSTIESPGVAPAATPNPEVAMASPTIIERSKTLLTVSIALALTGLVLILLMVRRARAGSGPSLITHAIGLKKK